MNAEKVIEIVHETGGKLAVIDGGLRAKNLNDSTRNLVRDNKAEIIILMVTQKQPYIKNGSELVIPSGCHPKYRWWDQGQSIFETLLELDAPDTLIEHHISELGSPKHWETWQLILKKRIASRVIGKESYSDIFANLKPEGTHHEQSKN